MKIDDSNKRYSMIIAGILLITVLPIFVAFSMGVMGERVFSDNNSPPIGGGIPQSSRKNNSVNTLNNYQESDELVSGSKSGCAISDMYTKKGSIDIIIEEDTSYRLPLCIDGPEDLVELNKALNITLLVCGGYCPQDEDSYLDLDQGTFCGTYRGGKILIDWIGPTKPGPCCCWDEYTAEFVWVPCTSQDICLVSSQLPDDGACWSKRQPISWGSNGLVKPVDIDLEIYWEGCHFWTIPSSDFQFPESPTPELIFKYSSPVECNNYCNTLLRLLCDRP
jgi:hypothetical protein